MQPSVADLAARELWACLEGDPSRMAGLSFSGPDEVWPTRFAVTAFASAAVGVATLAAAELWATRTGTPCSPVHVDAWGAAAAFRSEALYAPIGWEKPPVWDPFAGDYLAGDRYLRIHTNYASHRAAALQVLGLREAEGRARFAEAITSWEAEALETAIVEAGGCAAVLHTEDEWDRHPHGALTQREPAVALVRAAAAAQVVSAKEEETPSLLRPLEGLRVLDLTRVLAGPACTRFLAAHGAEVLRLDPPGFAEVAAVLPDMTVGKRCASLDLASAAAKDRFLKLLAEADVLVSGLRPGALERLGLDEATLRAASPRLVHARFDAYGWTGPWAARRGFDSLVQMSVGLAAPAIEGGKPAPLPAQALDHGLGYLMAAGVCRALTERARTGTAAVPNVRGSLLGVAALLRALPRRALASDAVPPASFPLGVFERTGSAWGPLDRVRCPGSLIAGAELLWRYEAGPLGTSEASF